MGRYINWTDVVGRYPDIAKIGGAEQVASSWLFHAEYEVDARLSVVYTTPFSVAPPIVQDLAIDLTYYKATLRQEGSDKIYEYIESRFAAIIAGTLVVTSATAVPIHIGQGGSEHASSFAKNAPLEWTPLASQGGDAGDGELT